MKLTLQLGALLLVSTGTLLADVPRKPVPSTYRKLWTDSPFTVKPTGPVAIQYNPLQDYVVIGVGPAEEGHRVTLLNSKRPNDGRFIVRSGQSNKRGIIIDEVIRQKDHREGDGTLTTKVRIKDATGRSAVVGFDRKFLAIKAPAPATGVKPVPQQRGRPPGTGANPQGQERVPRRRIIPPKAPTSGGQTSRSNSSQGNSSQQRRLEALQRLRNSTGR